MALRIAGIRSGFETSLPLVDSAMLASKCLSALTVDILLHLQLSSGAARSFGQGVRLLKHLVF